MSLVLGTTITWLGHACFVITTVLGTRILIDPMHPGIGYPARAHTVQAQLVFVSHEHADHNFVEMAMDTPNKPDIIPPKTDPGYQDGTYTALVNNKPEQIKFRRVFSYHDTVEGKLRGTNTITVFTIDGLRICHLGDLGQLKFSPKQLELIGKVDILMIPVGGFYTIDGKQAASVVGELKPRLIIPMHFQTPYLAADLHAKLHPVSEFVAAMSHRATVVPMAGPSIAITPKTLPAKPEIVLFTLHFPTSFPRVE